MDFEEATRRTLQIIKIIEERGGRKWDSKLRFIDMVEEVGELANAILCHEKLKSQKQRKSDLTDSVCDIMFDLLILAHEYGIDLNKEYPKVLDHIKERAEKKEFSD